MEDEKSGEENAEEVKLTGVLGLRFSRGQERESKEKFSWDGEDRGQEGRVPFFRLMLG